MPHHLTIVRPPDLGVTLALAVSRLIEAPLQAGPDALPHVDARLACGDFEGVRAFLRSARPDPALPYIVARYVTWTGDLQGAAAVWSHVLEALGDLLGPEGDESLRRRTAALLQHTATDLGDAPLAAVLHRHARGHARESSCGETPDPDVKVICDVAHELLGLEADASRGRLRLRPRTSGQRELEARHIRFGDGSLSVSAVRTHDRVTFRVEQVEGSIPITVLLEPFVEHPSSAEVDGHPADLAPRQVAGETIVPVQLVLDEARSLAVFTAPE